MKLIETAWKVLVDSTTPPIPAMDAADIKGISKQALYASVRRGQIQAVAIGERCYIEDNQAFRNWQPGTGTNTIGSLEKSKEWLAVQDVAALYLVTECTISKAIRDGRLKAHRGRYGYLIQIDDANGFIKKKRGRPRKKKDGNHE